MNAYVFPGQGAQYSGMGKKLCEQFSKAKEIFENADQILGFSISKMMFFGSDENLKQTHITQLAMFLHGYASFVCLAEEKPDMVAGHSLGEYTALAAVECLKFEDALRLVEKRARAMQKCCENQDSGMAAVLKFDTNIIEEICSSITDEVVVLANYNSPQQLVISGSRKGIDIAIEKLQQAGAQRIVMLNVGGAFHSPLMQPAQDELAVAINNCEIKSPICPVYQNVTALPTTDVDEIRNNLILQLTNPVRWTAIVNNMISAGADKIVEFGPTVLKALNKRINPNVINENCGSEM